MSRRPHYIRANKACETPSNAVWVDCETDEVDAGPDTIGHVLRVGWAAYSRTYAPGRWTEPDWCRFTTRKEFWDWLDARCKDKKTLYVFCHNSSFDYPVLDVFHELKARGWEMKGAVIDAPPTILTFAKGSKKIKALDTLNIWRVPLKALGEMIGLPKLDMPASTAPLDDWDIYNRRDVEIIMQACLQWWAWLVSEDMGGFAPTLASQAMRTWRHRYMPGKVLVHDNEALLSLEREAYHGGRVECFRLGTYRGSFHVLDVNSLYPSVMAGRRYPAQLAFYRRDAGTLDWRRWARDLCVVARCRISTDVPMYPVLAGGKLIFPVGEYETVLCGPELMEADRRGHLVAVEEAAFYRGAEIFTGFVDDLYARRTEARRAGNVTRSHNYKILMNSLYGKFGQRGQVWRELAPTTDLSARFWREVDAQTREIKTFRQLGGLVQELSAEPESQESCPAIAAYVTSYARIKLWGLIEAAGCENVFYCDTDSVVVNDAGRDRLKVHVDPDRLGMLKLERSVHRIVLRGAKDYTIGAKRKVKGVRKDAKWTSKNIVQQARWRGLKGQLQDGNVGMPTTTTVRKKLSRKYTKGTRQPSGAVAPLVLGDTPPAGG